MNIIDHRILVPAPPERVWQYLSDVSRNSEWQSNCRSVSFLTTMHTGVGTRWRCSGEDGRDTVFEIALWYERIGYEYTLIDGAPFGENKGQLRVQDTPDGTIVQWTFSYEIPGLFGGLRNIGVRRQTEQDIVDSLKNLWRVFGKSKDAVQYTAKSLMQDAPDVEERAQYKPRYPSKRAAVSITEPPVKPDDTKPRPVVIEDETAPEAAFKRPEVTPLAETPPVAEPQPAAPPSPPAETETAAFDLVRLPDEDDSEVETENMPRVEAPKNAFDTGRLSVFDLFGVPKPSETQEMQRVTLEVPTQPTSPAVPVVTESTPKPREGLRIKQRRDATRLRRPS